jgi:hypothetical protein
MTYLTARLFAVVYPTVTPATVDTRLWHFTGSHLHLRRPARHDPGTMDH